MEFPGLGEHCSLSSCKRLGKAKGYAYGLWFIFEEVKFNYKMREEKNLCYVLTFSRLFADEL